MIGRRLLIHILHEFLPFWSVIVVVVTVVVVVVVDRPAGPSLPN